MNTPMLLCWLVCPLWAGTADLSVSKIESQVPATLGSNLTYTITVENLGPDDAANVIVTDFLPHGGVFPSG